MTTPVSSLSPASVPRYISAIKITELLLCIPDSFSVAQAVYTLPVAVPLWRHQSNRVALS